jgi:hypothetical protein
MMYLKSAAVGLAALLAIAFATFLVLVVKYRPAAHGTPGWDPIPLVKLPIVQALALLIFGAGFY